MAADTGGLGLSLVRDRLRLVHPAATMDVSSNATGTCVTLNLPQGERP
jgi:hypothetical protein